jgi:hypothetical protein
LGFGWGFGLGLGPGAGFSSPKSRAHEGQASQPCQLRIFSATLICCSLVAWSGRAA